MPARFRWRTRTSAIADVTVTQLYNDPYPTYERLRRNSPVAAAPAVGMWLVTRWDEVEAVLADDTVFSSQMLASMVPASLRDNVLLTDGREHARLRAALQPSFQPRRARAFAESVVRAVADDLIDGFVAGGKAELVDDFCAPLAVNVGAQLLGLDDLPSADLRRWFQHTACHFMVEVPSSLRQKAAEINEEIDIVLTRRFRRLAEEADSSLLSSLVCGHGDAPGLTEEEAVANTKVLLFTSMQELRDLIGHVLLALLSHPEQLAQVNQDASLLKLAVEEAARWASPVGVVPRLTTSATELAGVPIPAGTLLGIAIGSANRDERRWVDPDAFNLHRKEGMHLAFASGIHFCLGAWLARAGTEVALQRILERMPNLGLEPGEPPVVRGWTFRGVRRLCATWA